MAWEELACATWCSGSSFSTGCFTAKKYLEVSYYADAAQPRASIRFNGDSLTNYAHRKNINGAECIGTNLNLMRIHSGGTNLQYTTLHIANISCEEKLVLWESINESTAGECTAPDRVEGTGKWDDTSQITSITVLDAQSNNFTGGKITVWGTD